MNAKAESPITNQTSAETDTKVTESAVTKADVKEAIAAPEADAPKKRGPKKAAVQNEETVVVAEAAEGQTEEAPAPKKRGRKPGVKNSTSKKETAKKTASKKAAKTAAEKAPSTRGTSKNPEEQITIQYAGKECTKDDLMNRVNEIWANDYGKKASEMKKVAFYVKPEEFAVYYVINDDITGKFDI